MGKAKKQLAIVIPAYKDTFFAQTLESIANQTNHDFTLYIGDDLSPYDLSSIVAKFKDKIDIVYKRFSENVGGKDLVAQWERCINLTQDEEWIWLFSDDDMMHPQCVESFYKEIEQTPMHDLYRFDVDTIDNTNKVIGTCLAPSDVITSRNLYMLKQKGKMNSFVVEYVFSRKIYSEQGGFQQFDLAWGSDTATWIKFGFDKGIKVIRDTHVKWRASGQNITTKQEYSLLNRKLNATIDYMNWLIFFLQSKGENKIAFIDAHCLKRVLGSAGLLPFRDCYRAFKRYNNSKPKYILSFLLIVLFPLYLCNYKLHKK